MKMDKTHSLIILFFISVSLLWGCTASGPLQHKEFFGRENKTHFTPYHITSNVPGAKVITNNGNLVGECPVTGELEWIDAKEVYSPYGEMVEIVGTLEEMSYFFVGKIVAPGYHSKSFRENIGHFKVSFGSDSYLKEKILINAYLEPLDQEKQKTAPQQQQQQQQQQTVIIPDTGSREKGTIIISSTPQNADVIVDGIFVGNSPCTLPLKEGIHIIEVKLSGYKSYRRELRVISGGEVPIRVTLEQK